MSRSPASPGTGKQHKTAQDIRQIVFDTFGPWPHVSPWAKLSIRNAGNSWKLSIRNGDVTKKNGGEFLRFHQYFGDDVQKTSIFDRQTDPIPVLFH